MKNGKAKFENKHIQNLKIIERRATKVLSDRIINRYKKQRGIKSNSSEIVRNELIDNLIKNHLQMREITQEYLQKSQEQIEKEIAEKIIKEIEDTLKDD